MGASFLVSCIRISSIRQRSPRGSPNSTLASPLLLIELYFADHEGLAVWNGENNALKEDAPGVRLRIEFNPEFVAEYAEYVTKPELTKTIPIEYYSFVWMSFADCALTTSRSIALKLRLIRTPDKVAVDNDQGYSAR